MQAAPGTLDRRRRNRYPARGPGRAISQNGIQSRATRIPVGDFPAPLIEQVIDPPWTDGYRSPPDRQAVDPPGPERVPAHLWIDPRTIDLPGLAGSPAPADRRDPIEKPAPSQDRAAAGIAPGVKRPSAASDGGPGLEPGCSTEIMPRCNRRRRKPTPTARAIPDDRTEARSKGQQSRSTKQHAPSSIIVVVRLRGG